MTAPTAPPVKTNTDIGGIVHVITGLGTGGAEAQLVRLAGHQAARGHAVRVVALTAGGANAEALRAAGVAVSDVGARRGRPSLGAVWRLRALLRAARPLVVQSWLYHADLYATAALALAGGRRATRFFWGVRCSRMDAARYRWTTRVLARLSRYPDGVVANSEAGAAAHEALGYRPRRLVRIDNGIDTERFRPDPAVRAAVRAELAIADDVVLLAHAARRDPMKDHETLLAALDRLGRLGRPGGVKVLCIGAGTETLPDRPDLLRLGARADVPRLLAACDLVVSSSAFGEGFSNALAEGMACGLPAVATDVGDAARLVGDCGRIVPTRDAPALAEAIAACAAADRAAPGAQARQRIEQRFSLARMFAAYDQLYEFPPHSEPCAASPAKSDSAA